MRILALDPGNEQTGYVVWCTKTKTMKAKGTLPNSSLLSMIADQEASIRAGVLAVEDVISYGMRVGKSTFDTCKWIGRFENEWKNSFEGQVFYISSPDARDFVTGNSRARDKDVKEAICDKHYGGITKATGTKKEPGPMFGVGKHEWPALAVALSVTHREGL